MSELKHDDWKGTTYGNGWMHRWLIRSLRIIDVRLVYAFASVFVIPVVMVINRKARKVIYRFYRDRIGCGRIMSWWKTYRNHCAFSQVVVDRFAMYTGLKFKIEIEGAELFQTLSERSSGFIQFSSHTGNYEIAGYSLVAKNKRFNALVFGGEKESIKANRSRLFDGNNIRVIPVAEDMSHLFVVDRALDDGEILSMPADRVFGSQKAFSVDFMGAKATFPQGPFVLAAIKNVPVLFVSVIKTAAKVYRITVLRVESLEEGNTKERALYLAKQYAALLESVVRKHPEQWYNYYDFWAN